MCQCVNHNSCTAEEAQDFDCRYLMLLMNFLESAMLKVAELLAYMTVVAAATRRQNTTSK